ncbi:unnamed protein product [Amoebophrya sp. A120]|nr:unnamed protein product [Amoebophrya sp. A120]|eukprot:GSA120T00000588001.1
MLPGTTKTELPRGVMLTALAVVGAAYFTPGIFVDGVSLRPAFRAFGSPEIPQEQMIRVRVGLSGDKTETLPGNISAAEATQKLHAMAAGLVPGHDAIVYGSSSTPTTATVDSLLQVGTTLGSILPPGTEEIQLVAGSPRLFEEMPADGRWNPAEVQLLQQEDIREVRFEIRHPALALKNDIREVLRISTDDLIEDRYATAAKKKYNRTYR